MIWTPIIAIIAIATLEAIALLNNVDGALFGIAIAAISGLGGYQIKVLKDKKTGGK